MSVRRSVEDGRESNGLELRAIGHTFEREPVIDDVNLTISPGEFVAVLGPSGCGKTTLLRIIAGFLRPGRGRVLLDGADITRTPPHRRPINMVSQRPTLFPHLDVSGNIGFGLRMSGLSRWEADQQVVDAMRLLDLTDLAGRRNYELSGGQMQRVALARALVNRPRLFLLDEPLSALDAPVRAELEDELRRLHRRIATTFVYVTHDQREALALAQRVVVVGRGRVEQIGTPRQVYHRPESAFVAEFVGRANVVPCDVEGDARLRVGRRVVAAPPDARIGPAWLVIRRENVTIHPDGGASDAAIPARVIDMAFRGATTSYQVRLADVDLEMHVESNSSGHRAFTVGELVTISWKSTDGLCIPRDEK